MHEAALAVAVLGAGHILLAGGTTDTERWLLQCLTDTVPFSDDFLSAQGRFQPFPRSTFVCNLCLL